MISGVVFTLLSPLVPAGRCAADMFPQENIGPPGTIVMSLSKPTIPAIRYTVIDSFNAATICGTDTRDTDDTLVQIDVVAPTDGARSTLADQVIAILQTATPPCERKGYSQSYDYPTKTYRALIDFDFHPSSGSGSP